MFTRQRCHSDYGAIKEQLSGLAWLINLNAGPILPCHVLDTDNGKKYGNQIGQFHKSYLNNQIITLHFDQLLKIQ